MFTPPTAPARSGRPSRTILRVALCGAALATLGACQNFDLDMRDRTGGFGTAEAVQGPAAARPAPDARGVISYPTYQVAVAQRGDTVAALAARVGLPPEDVARFNGLETGMGLRDGEIVALPSRVSEPPGGFAGGAGVTTQPLGGSGRVDVTTLAGSAIDRASVRPGSSVPAGTIAPPRGSTEPVRHQVVRGETAFSIARLYGVSVRTLADWNGLGPDLTVREGAYLIIPLANAPTPETATRPGQGSPTPVPPSSTAPLPGEDETGAVTNAPASPNLGAERTPASGTSKLAMPVSGSIIRAYEKGKNEGIDISASAGANVTASAAGTVAAVTKSTDNVSIVILRHDGAAFGASEPILTVYANLEGITVERGATVSRGQSIGKVRAATPSFIRFEVRRGFETLDPGDYLQ